jgi:hypothetical protein
MRLNRNCRDVTRLVLEGEERRLPLGDRLAVRLHMVICKACPVFQRQVKLMRGAMGQWRSYRDH